jgi:hypothetical protein
VPIISSNVHEIEAQFLSIEHGYLPHLPFICSGNSEFRFQMLVIAERNISNMQLLCYHIMNSIGMHYKFINDAYNRIKDFYFPLIGHRTHRKRRVQHVCSLQRRVHQAVT